MRRRSTGRPWLRLLPAVLAGTLAFTSIGVLLGTVLPSARAAQAAGQVTIAEGDKADIDKDKAIADKAEIRGTPGFTINGYFVSGAQPFPQFDKLIKLALKEAK